MIEYLDAAHEAYRRLKHAEQNRPSHEQLAAIAKEERQERRRQTVARFRRSIA